MPELSGNETEARTVQGKTNKQLKKQPADFFVLLKTTPLEIANISRNPAPPLPYFDPEIENDNNLHKKWMR
jgi:hypothetical protein